jgi:hypothetical protein
MVVIVIAIAMIVQVAAAGVLVFGDIGFDIPGRYGLDIVDGIVLAALFVIALLFGVTICVIKKKRVALGVQLIIPVLFVGYHIFPRPDPKLDAAQFQHLIGMSRTEAQSELGRFRTRVTGTMREAGATEDLEFEGYNGLTIYYSAAGTVVRVK